MRQRILARFRETANFTGTWIAPGVGVPNPGTGIVYFVEPWNQSLVSDIITASWSNTGLRATITFAIQSSPERSNLGPPPAAFAGLGIVETASFLEKSDSFRNSSTAAAVSIPSNLTVQLRGLPPASTSAPALSLVALALTSLLLLGINVMLLKGRTAKLE